MHITREHTDSEFLGVLQRLQPATIHELCDACAVTATAVRQRLTRLLAEGLVSRKEFRQERGRPRHEYQLTPQAVRFLGDDHAEIAAILWREIMRIGEGDVRQQTLQRVRDALITRFGTSTTESGVAGRLAQMCAMLSEHGFDVDYEVQTPAGGLTILREHNCPYHGIADEDNSICDMEQSVFSALLGMPVELSSCRLDGHSCCEFQVGGSS